MTPTHPGFRLSCWLLLVAAVQCLSGLGLAVGLAMMVLAGAPSLRRWYRLLRRTRWLLLSLLLVLGWSVAGTPLWEGTLPAPTVEGLQDGATQLVRLSLVLAAVAVLLETTPVPALMAGCRMLLLPLRHLGINADHAVVRLSLVLHYADESAASDWRSLLRQEESSGPETIRLPEAAVRVGDWLALALTVAIALLACIA